MSPLKRALDILGGPANMARAIGEKPATVSAWDRRAHGRVPAEHCPDIELATKGRVKCEELRPDVKWWVLRGGQPSGPAANDANATGQLFQQ